MNIFEALLKKKVSLGFHSKRNYMLIHFDKPTHKRIIQDFLLNEGKAFTS